MKDFFISCKEMLWDIFTFDIIFMFGLAGLFIWIVFLYSADVIEKKKILETGTPDQIKSINTNNKKDFTKVIFEEDKVICYVHYAKQSISCVKTDK